MKLKKTEQPFRSDNEWLKIERKKRNCAKYKETPWNSSLVKRDDRQTNRDSGINDGITISWRT